MTEDLRDSDLRRRAAWLLFALAIVAVLVVVLLTTLLSNSGGGGGPRGNSAAPDDTLHPSSNLSASAASANASPGSGKTTGSHPTGRSTGTTPTTSQTGPTTTSCPSAQPCILQGDAANVIAAINDYRAKHGEGPITGAVTKAAQRCALSNGGGACTGSWAESQVGTFDGKAAVAKMAKLGNLLSHTVKSIDVGWAYSPPQKQYYIAMIWHG